MLGPTYLGRKVIKLKILEIPLELNLCWVEAAVLYDIEDTATILVVNKLDKQD